MMQVIPRLEVDYYANNPNNFIRNEPHTLSTNNVRSIAPKHGVFYAKDLVIRDGATTLVRGQHYQLVELHQELTLKTGKEVCSVILITDRSVSANLEVNYRAVGSHYSQDNSAIGNMFESLSVDDRPVDWANVLRKQATYAPTEHPHLLSDVFGFEYVVDMLERLRSAITLGQTRVVLEIIDSLLSKFKCKELPLALPSNKLIQYDALLYFLSRRKILNDIWIEPKTCYWTKGQTGSFDIDTSGYPVGTDLYWQFYQSHTQNVGLFTDKEGWIKANGGIVTVTVYVPSDLTYYPKNLYIGVKEHPDDVDFKAVTYVLDIREPVTTTVMFPYLLNAPTEAGEYDMFISAIDGDDERRLYAAYSNY